MVTQMKSGVQQPSNIPVNDLYICEECGGPVINADTGYTCSQCGLINQLCYESPLLKISAKDNKEYGVFNYFGDREHIIDGMGSFIDYYGSTRITDGNKRRLSQSSEKMFLRLKRINDQQLHTINRESDYRALRILNRMTSLFRLTKQIRNRAAYLFRIMVPHVDKSPRLNRVILVATSLYVALREHPDSNVITFNELGEGFKRQGHRVSKKLITRALWELRPLLSEALDFSKILSKSKDYISTVLNHLHKSSKIEKRLTDRQVNKETYYQLLFKKTQNLLQSIPFKVRGGRNPYVFTVSVVYAADQFICTNQLRVRPILSQKLVSETAKVAEYSVRDHYVNVLAEFVE